MIRLTGKRDALILALVAGFVLVEATLRFAPSMLPRSYLATFPANGCEFFHPSVLRETPVEGVLLPHLATAHDGLPYSGLVKLGIAPHAEADRRAFPRVVLPADALGFPNAAERARADLVLIGDSFAVATGVLEPEGLQLALERASGLTVHNLGLGGIGPVQERWLLETRALALAPRAVLWLYYSGNDLTESYQPLLARRLGHATWAEAWPERGRPWLVVPDLLVKAFRGQPARSARAPLPGFRLPRASGGAHALWFEPESLRQLGWSRAEWEAHPMWAPVQVELRAARDACAAAGVRFLLVYLPSKPEVVLPLVARDAALVRRAIEFLDHPAPALEPEAHLDALLAHRHAHEELLRDFCARESIPFLSATPALEAQATRGELGYLAADTHWNSLGQAALLEPLLDFLRREGLLH